MVTSPKCETHPSYNNNKNISSLLLGQYFQIVSLHQHPLDACLKCKFVLTFPELDSLVVEIGNLPP